MKSIFQKISVVLMLAAFVLGTTGCHTMAGVGKDTQKAGEKIEKEAERHTDDKDDNKK